MTPGFPLQFLKRGKALCSAAFPNFVDTWNWLVNAASNLKGDADVNNGQGHITVDWSAVDHPVVRCTGCAASAADNDGVEESVYARAWELVRNVDEKSNITYQLLYCYYNRGGATYDAGNIDVVIPDDAEDVSGFVVAKFRLVVDPDDEDTDATVTAHLYKNLTEVRDLQSNQNYYYVPLYQLTSSTRWIDLRTTVQLQVFDFAPFA